MNSAVQMAPSPSLPLRLDIPQVEQEQQQNGGTFHSISLRSPADKPVILGFDGNGAVCNGSIGISASGDKSPTEGNSQGQLIEYNISSKPSKLPSASLRSICKFLSSRRFLLALVAFLTIFALFLIISLVFVILKWGKQQYLEDAEFLNRDSSWRDGCERKCNAKFDVPPLLLISMDGFRADYLQRKITPSVQRIMQCGAHAEYMLPSYPSKTFPNHYTIVTGLYPESHGIVDNHFYDEEMPNEKNFAKSSRNPIWYNGEPIWNTVTKNGKKSAIFFWPGSEVPIQGMLPTYRYNYNASLPFSKRVDQVIDWLRLDETDRPSFLAMYFEQPDTAMHREGPDSDAVNSALIYVDAMINYLMQQLDNNGFLGCINLVILSDHGAQKLREDHFIAMDQFVDARDPHVGGVFGGTIGHINFKKSARQAFIERVLEPMSCLGGQTFRVYTRESMPKRYHYTKSERIGEIVIDSVGGTRLFVDQRSLKEHGSLEKGDHGYDNRMREMRAIFGAWGHSIKRAYEEKPFQNIELYNLFTALMQLPVTVPNNGTIGRLHSILREPPSLDSTPFVELTECDGARLIKCGDGCHFELNYQPGSVFVPSSLKEDSSIASSSSSSSVYSLSSGQHSTNKVPVYNGQNCKYADRILMSANFANKGRQCIIRLCNSTLVFNRRLRMANFVESQLTAPIPNIDHRANCTAHFVVPNSPAQKTSPPTTTTSMQGATDGQMATTTTMTGQKEEGRITSGKRSLSADDDDIEEGIANDQDSHLISDSTMTTHSSAEGEQQHAPWNRPAEMDDNSISQTAVETTTLMQSRTMAENETETTTMANDNAQPIQPSPTLQSPQQLECGRLQQQHQNLGLSSSPTSIDSNSLWISLFPDNDYARYIFQGQFRVPQGFYNGPWKQILTLIRQYVQHYKRLLMWSGPVFDHDHNGLADALILGGNNNFDDSIDGPTMPSINISPSHIFLILLRCSNNIWAANGRQCDDPKMTKTLAFVLPLVEKDLNCLFPVEYIFRHTARIMDIELLTGNEWFLDRQIYPQELAIQLRTKINEQLWQLELKN